MTHHIDLNCDMGEGTGAWRAGQDDALLDLVTSANIACGFHAGDPSIMERTVKAALSRGVSVGAHPALPDLQGFGRRSMTISPDEAYSLVLYQIGALDAFVRAAGGKLHHIKPHGALYNQAAKDAGLADAIARAVRDFEPGLILMGLSGSELLRAGRALGLVCASEVFADRGYEPDGSLTPRGTTGAMIEDEGVAVSRVLRMIREGMVQSRTGEDVEVRADTVCIHGDHPQALAFARRLRKALAEEGVVVRTL
jgi:UPF0271 protein